VTLDRFRLVVMSVVFPVTMAGVIVLIFIVVLVITPIRDDFATGLPFAETAEILLPDPLRATWIRIEEDGVVLVDWRRVFEDDVEYALPRYGPRAQWAIVSVEACMPFGRVKATLGKLGGAGVSRITLRTATRMSPRDSTQ